MTFRLLIAGCLILAAIPFRAVFAGVYLTGSGDRVGEIVDLRLEITPDVELNAGDEIIIASHWLDSRRFTSKASDANQISYSTTPEVVLSDRLVAMTGIHGGLESLVENFAIVVDTGALPADGVISVQILDYRLPETALSQYQIPVYIRRQGGEMQLLPSNSLPIRPGAAARLHVSADSLVQPGEDVGLAIRVEDRFGNLIEDRPMSLDLLVNGRFRNRVDVQQSFQRISDVVFDMPGIYSIEARSGGGGLRAESNPVWVRSEVTEKVIWLGIGEFTQAGEGWRSADEVRREGQGYFDLVLPAEPAEVAPGDAGLEQAASEVQADPRGNLSYFIETEQPGSTVGRLQLAANRLLGVALPEQPTDIRFQSPLNLQAAAIVTGGSVHEWLVNSLAARGYSPALIAVSHSRQYPAKNPRALTGVIVSAGQTVAEALAEGRTIAASGERIVIRVDRNRSLPMTDSQQFQVEVFSASSIHSIELYRNGELASSRTGELLPDAENLTVSMSLFSDSKPSGALHSRPRNGREWIGYVATRDSALNVTADAQWRLYQGQDARRGDFLVHTHGRAKRAQLTLSNPTADTVLELGLAPVIEDAAWLPEDRLPAEIPGQRFLVSIGELERGADRAFDVAGYRDVVTFEPATQPLESPQSVTFKDPRKSRLGDYYYVRVELENGAVAYSSVYLVDHTDAPQSTATQPEPANAPIALYPEEVLE